MKQAMTKVAATLFAAIALTGCGGAYVAYRSPGPPPRPLAYGVVGRAPGPGYIWVDGYHDWRGRGYVWVPGSWMRPPHPRAVWVPGHFNRHGHREVWVRGHWRR